jgi:hypothetical protein
MFFVLRGWICFQAEGTTIEARTGDSVVVPEGGCTISRTPVQIASNCAPS